MKSALPAVIGALWLLAPAVGACGPLPAGAASGAAVAAANANAPEPTGAVLLFGGLTGLGALLARRRVIAARFGSD